MREECSLTRETCYTDFEYEPHLCPYYKSSSYYYAPGESETGAKAYLNNVCRFYGIKRAQKLRNKNFMEG